MKLGCFGFVRHIPLIQQAGFDCAELDIMEIAGMDRRQLSDLTSTTRDSGLGFWSFSGFMPLTERMHNADFDMHRWFDHAEASAERTARLGARLWTFGAGKCRSIPENYPDVEGARARVAEFVAGICDRIAPFGLTLVVEPLGPANSNYLNLIGEAVAFVRALGKPNCKSMCDLRHMHKLDESLSDIVTYRDDIVHAHIDYPRGMERYFPRVGDGFDYSPYIETLKEAEYQGMLVVEATAYSDFLSDARSCVTHLEGLGAR